MVGNPGTRRPSAERSVLINRDIVVKCKESFKFVPYVSMFDNRVTPELLSTGGQVTGKKLLVDAEKGLVELIISEGRRYIFKMAEIEWEVNESVVRGA